MFRNTNNGAAIEIDLAAGDEGVAFRYRFPETNDTVRIVEAELTGFALPLECARLVAALSRGGAVHPRV